MLLSFSHPNKNNPHERRGSPSPSIYPLTHVHVCLRVHGKHDGYVLHVFVTPVILLHTAMETVFVKYRYCLEGRCMSVSDFMFWGALPIVL